MRIVGISHIGHVRGRNEDAIGWDDTLGLAVVADGMGGHPSGDVASQLAVESALAEARRQCPEPRHWLSFPGADAAALVDHAHRAILDHARAEPADAGLGTTLVLAAVAPPRLAIAHVGDSRAYRLRDGALEQLSHDHNEAGAALRAGWLTSEEARRSPARHQLLQALGTPEAPVPEVLETDWRDGDRLLLCSDGLTGELDDDTIRRLLDDPAHAGEAVCHALIDAALQAGGRDNIAVVLVA